MSEWLFDHIILWSTISIICVCVVNMTGSQVSCEKTKNAGFCRDSWNYLKYYLLEAQMGICVCLCVVWCVLCSELA